jgi:hypothetical protein
MDSGSAKLIELHPLIPEGSHDADYAATLPAQQLSLRARQVLHLQMQGLPRTEIAIRLGLSEGHVGRITRSPDYVAARDVLLEREEAVLRAMKPMAFRALEDGLSSRDEYTRLQAAALYFKISGYMHHGKCVACASDNVTAEDVARHLLLAQQSAQPAVNTGTEAYDTGTDIDTNAIFCAGTAGCTEPTAHTADGVETT